MNYNAWFQCINGCPGQYNLLEIIYRCPTCGDLLEVHHDEYGGGGAKRMHSPLFAKTMRGLGLDDAEIVARVSRKSKACRGRYQRGVASA